MSRRLRIEFHPAAEAELLEAATWDRARSEKAGAAFRREVERGVTRIAAAPERWPDFKDGARRCLLRRFPFSLVNRLLGDAIQILAVAHGARRPGYWRSRR